MRHYTNWSDNDIKILLLSKGQKCPGHSTGSSRVMYANLRTPGHSAVERFAHVISQHEKVYGALPPKIKKVRAEKLISVKLYKSNPFTMMWQIIKGKISK